MKIVSSFTQFNAVCITFFGAQVVDQNIYIKSQSYWKLIFKDINLKCGPQLVYIYGFDFHVALQ